MLLGPVAGLFWDTSGALGRDAARLGCERVRGRIIGRAFGAPPALAMTLTRLHYESAA